MERGLARWPELPVIINSDRATLTQSDFWSKTDFVSKSSDLNELMLHIQQMLDSPAAVSTQPRFGLEPTIFNGNYAQPVFSISAGI